jgi:ATP-dependent helicase Lhr and Lhr-like helicase
MNSPLSSSDATFSALGELDVRIRRWIWEKGWTSLRDAQEQALRPLLEGKSDVIIAAATASGKTEAAFLPILSRLAAHGDETGLALYISPLKALINDQWGRLEQLCETLEVPVTPWHGDITATRKGQFLKRPEGVLLITPESLEALFVRRGSELRRIFSGLHYIVIDELHAFIGSDRGKQLQSLLRRIELVSERRVPRVGLSATLGDMTLAQGFLRANPSEVILVESHAASQELQIQVRGYQIENVKKSLREDPPGDSQAFLSIAAHLFQVLRGSNNLLFPNSRQRVEYFADLLRRRCEEEGVPNEFWPHHGSLSRDLREAAERALKDGSHPATAVCTTTLELGIDIGAVKTVAQIGPPPSVASLRQRLGRSGRRPGEPAILRAYVTEHELTINSPLSDRLREGLIQTIATVQLLRRRWFEPPRAGGLHLSTMVQQVLSIIAERGGATAADLSATLIDAGPFAALTHRQLMELLRELGRHELITQEASGALLLGTLGEKLVNSYDFYAAFASTEEWQIVQDGNRLGTLPIDSPVSEGACIIFGGRRWKILGIAENPNVLTVAPDPKGKAPQFDSGRPMVHEEIRFEMRRLLAESADISYLDAPAKILLQQARLFYQEAKLSTRDLMTDGEAILLLPWSGDFAQNALVLLLQSLGLPSASNEGLIVTCEGWSRDRLLDACSDIGALAEVDLLALLHDAGNLQQGKWDWALPRGLLIQSYASLHLDVPGAQGIARRLAATDVG